MVFYAFKPFFLWILEATQNLSNKIFWPHGIGSIVFNTKITFLTQIFLNQVFTREKNCNNLRISKDMTLREKQIVVRKLYSFTQNDSFYFLNVIWGKSFYFYIQSDFFYSKCQLFFSQGHVSWETQCFSLHRSFISWVQVLYILMTFT